MENQLQMSSTSPSQQSRDSEGFSESGATGSEEKTRRDLCSDQEITTKQSITLTDTNFAEVYDVMSEVRDMWFNIGLQLGITIVVLKSIEETYREGLYALREVLIKCKDQCELQDLIEALRKPSVDQPVCARRLEDLVNKLRHDASSATGSHSIDVKDGKENPFARVTRITKREARKAACKYNFEVVIVGDPTVGKTTTVNKYFNIQPDLEIGRSTVAITQHDPRVFEFGGQHVQLVLWDMPGNDECFQKVDQCYFEMADGAILMFDVTNRQSLINLLSDKDNTRKIKRSWKKELMFRAIDNKHPMMILVGNKIDAEKREVQKRDVEEMLKSRDLDMPYFEISSKEDLDIDNVFDSVVEMLIKKASQDARYGQLTRSNRHSNNSIHASSVTHPFEDDTLMVPRTKSLPTSRSNQVNNRGCVIVDVVPAVQQEQPSPPPRQEQPPASGSGDILRRCVIL